MEQMLPPFSVLGGEVPEVHVVEYVQVETQIQNKYEKNHEVYVLNFGDVLRTPGRRGLFFDNHMVLSGVVLRHKRSLSLNTSQSVITSPSVLYRQTVFDFFLC